MLEKDHCWRTWFFRVAQHVMHTMGSLTVLFTSYILNFLFSGEWQLWNLNNYVIYNDVKSFMCFMDHYNLKTSHIRQNLHLGIVLIILSYHVTLLICSVVCNQYTCKCIAHGIFMQLTLRFILKLKQDASWGRCLLDVL